MAPRSKAQGDPPPLDTARLRALALRYVERYQVSEAKLSRYLARKLWERGWAGDGPAPVAELVAQFAGLGYVDDRAFGEARTRGLASRGFGPRRVTAELGAAGLARDLASELGDTVDARAAAERFAQRRRFGPWDRAAADPNRRRRQVAAMLRAGHAMDVVKAVLGGRGDAED